MRGGGAARVVGSSLTTTIAAYLPAFLLGGMAVQLQEDLGFDETALGLAIGVFFAVGAVSSPYVGKLAAYLGPERSLRSAALIDAAVQLLIAAFAHSVETIVVLFAFAGLANVWAQPASNVVIAKIVPKSRLGVTLGLQKSAIPMAALLGGLAVPAIALTVGWRWAFVAGAVFAVASALHVPRPVGATGGGAARRREGRPDVPMRHLAILAVGVGFGSAASNALSAFLVVSGVQAGLNEAMAGLMLTLGSIAGVGVRLLVGAMADRRPGRTLPVMVVMFVVADASFVLLATGVAGLYLVATPLAFATAYAWPGLFQLAVVRSNPSAPGTATGVAMTGTLSGAVAGPVVFGFIAGAGAYTAAWLVAAAFLVAAAVIVGIASRLIDEPDGSTPEIVPSATGRLEVAPAG